MAEKLTVSGNINGLAIMSDGSLVDVGELINNKIPCRDQANQDGLTALCEELYGRQPLIKDYLGGADARMLFDAAIRINQLLFSLKEISHGLDCFLAKYPLHGAFMCKSSSLGNIAVFARRRLKNISEGKTNG